MVWGGGLRVLSGRGNGSCVSCWGRARKWNGKVALGLGVRVMSCRGDGQCQLFGELGKGGLGFGSGSRER